MEPDVIFESFSAGGCRSYLLGCADSCAAVLIDPEIGLIDRYLATAARDGLRIRYLVDTHTHADHFSATQELAQRLQQWAGAETVPLAFTQWTAAWARHPYTEPAVCSAYVERLPDAATLEQLGLRPVNEGGKLWLHVPDDEGILTETQTRSSLTLVTDAQIYLDLKRTGLRGPEAAAALREWEGFCRP